MSALVTPRRAWLALIAMVPAVLTVGLDITVLSVALPTLARALSASTSDLQWFVMAYTLTFAAAIIPSGMLADRFGRKRILLGSLVLFGLGSLACTLSQNSGQLIAARALLGIGAAGISTMSIAIIAVLFEPRLRGRAFTAIMLVNMLGMPLGPILGGWMLEHFGWGWIFLINVPIVLIALVSAAILMPESRAEVAPKWDLMGLVTLSASLVLVCYGITQAGSDGWSDTSAWLPTLIGGALLALFIVIESLVAHPLVPLGMFKRPRFTVGAVSASVLSFMVAGMLFIVPQYTQAVLGATTEQSGFYLLSFAVGMLLASLISPKLQRLMGRGFTIAVGMSLIAVALWLGAQTTMSSQGGWLVFWATLTGFGFGIGLPTAMDFAMGDLDRDSSGVGSGVLQALRQVATTIGAAVLGSMLASQYRDALPKGLPHALEEIMRKGVEQGLYVAHYLQSDELLHEVRAAFVHAMTQVWGTTAIVMIVTVAGLVIGVVVHRITDARRRRSELQRELVGVQE